MSFGAVAIGLGVAAAGASAYGAYSQSQAQDRASRRARSDAEAQRELELQLFREGRGVGGYSVLPLYAQRDGRPVEPELFADALRVYDVTGSLTPEQRMAQYRADLEAFGPAQAAALASASGVFSGDTLRREIAAQEPVFAARTQLAKSRGASALEKAAENANAALAILSAKRGFTGTSSFEQRPILEMRRRGLQEQATELGQANLLNETDAARTRLGNISRELNSLNLPFQLARQQAEFRQLPEQQAIDFQTRRMAAFQPFNIGPAAFFRPSPLPTPTPRVGTGQIIGQGLGSLGNTASDYLLTQSLLDQMKQQQGNQQQLQSQRQLFDYYNNPALYQQPMVDYSLYGERA